MNPFINAEADDLFAGAGGWDLAARALGIHARGIENMKEARATRDAAGLTTIWDDVWTFDPLYNHRRDGETNAEVYLRIYRETGSGVIAGVASGQIASPPCQTFSQAGKGAGRKALDAVLSLIPELPRMTLQQLREEGRRLTPPDRNGRPDDRTALVLTPLWFLLHHGTYRWAAWEQVPTVLPVWEACADVLRAEGWSVWTGLLHAEQYGVPQTRKRAGLIASRDRRVTPPVPTHSRYHSRSPERLDDGVLKWVSMADAIDFGLRARPAPTVTGGGTETGGAEPIAKLARYTDRADWIDRPTHMGDVYNSKGCIRSVDEPAPTMTASMDNGNFRWHTPAVLAPAGTSSQVVDPRPITEPAATITGRGTAEWGERSTRAPGPKARDPKGVRVEVWEAGVLQSFPADYPWQGNKGKQYLQAGNAIPPLLALHTLAAVRGVELPIPNTGTLLEEGAA